MKNLIRRQVVPSTEFNATFGGKTAEEWATYYQKSQLAEEIRYYVSRLETRTLRDIQEINLALLLI